MADLIIWWDRLVVEDVFFPDGEMEASAIPAVAWTEHRARHNAAQHLYHLSDKPKEIFAAAGDIMVGYGEAKETVQ